MNRKETTEFLSDLLVQRKLEGKYYASEVTLDFGRGKGKEKRVDFIQFVPKNQSTSGIEKRRVYILRGQELQGGLQQWKWFDL